jgi:outer membrane receptor for ferrienterochelin and colicin
MPSQPARIALSALLLSPVYSIAQTLAPPPSTEQNALTAASAKEKSGESKRMQQVEVKGTAADYDPRRDDTASKTVLNSEEIKKYGDDNVYDVLKRAPGVTVTGNTIRMRGLGAGYTQILVNGDRPPPGFSLDNLKPDQIERIEIVRSASAEYSMQAIAGTINIVLRKVVAKAQHDLRIGAANSPLSHNASIGGTVADKMGQLSYFLNGGLYGGEYQSMSASTDEFRIPTGELTQQRASNYYGTGHYLGGYFYPRLAWKFDSGDELNVQVGAMANRGRYGGGFTTSNLVGSFPQPEWMESFQTSPNNQRMASVSVNWIAKLAGGKLDLTLSTERSRSDSDAWSQLYTEHRALGLERDWDAASRDSRKSIRSKFTRSMFDGHALATGLDASVQKTDETRERREQYSNAAPTDIVEDFTPRITRLAAFVQDEWSIDKQLSIYLGLRWEGVQTDSEGTGLAASHSRSQVLGPVAQTLYKFPGASGRQLRLALTRTYKAPAIEQLTAKRYEAALNTRFTPDSGGNPALRPELANGIDLTYEHFWSPGALFAVTGSRRAITDYIRTRLDQDAQGRWLYQPINDGTAQVYSLAAELKAPLRLINAALDGFDARASASRNWSHVTSVPGPDNRLDAQVPFSANLGVDYKKGDLGLGASLAFQRGGWVRISEPQSQRQQYKRDLDAYALWKLNPHYQLRFTLANIFGTDATSERLYSDDRGVSRQVSFQPGYTRVGVNLEMKL